MDFLDPGLYRINTSSFAAHRYTLPGELHEAVIGYVLYNDFFYLISSRYALKSEFVHGMTLLQNEIIVDTILHPRLGVVNLLRVKGSNFFISL